MQRLETEQRLSSPDLSLRSRKFPKRLFYGEASNTSHPTSHLSMPHFAVSSVKNALMPLCFSPPHWVFPPHHVCMPRPGVQPSSPQMSGHGFCSQEPPECQPQGKTLCTHYHVELSIKHISAQDFTPFKGEKTNTEVTGWP